jgi:DNA replication protein DnaC
MLIEPMIQQLHQLRLHGMAGGLEQLLRSAQLQALSFEERLSVMIQHEITQRDSKRLAQRLRWAKLPQNAALEDFDTRTPPGVDPKLIAMLAALTWIKEKLNVLITGPCGIGKSFIASALAHAACRADYSVRSAEGNQRSTRTRRATTESCSAQDAETLVIDDPFLRMPPQQRWVTNPLIYS